MLTKNIPRWLAIGNGLIHLPPGATGPDVFCKLADAESAAAAATAPLLAKIAGLEVAYKDMRELAESAADSFRDASKTIAELEAKLAQRVPDGWKLVPIDPTEEMLAAGDDACARAMSLRMVATYGVYGAMLSAAPAAPGQQDQSEQHLDMVAQASNAQQAEAQEPDDAALLKALNAIKPMDRTKLFEMAVPLTQEEIAEAESDRAIPKAWANFTEGGNIRIWSKNPETVEWTGLPLVPLFTRPQPAQLQALSEEEATTAWRGVKDVGDDKRNAILLGEAIQSALAAKNGMNLK